MIELDLVAYLKSDTTLDGLLGASSGDSKIYPDQVSHGKSTSIPYIIYSIASDLRQNEVIEEVTINFNCVSTSHLTSRLIRDRLISLLDHDDIIQQLVASDRYFIYSARLTGGTSFVDAEIGYYHNVATFTILYGRVGFTVPSSTVVSIDNINKIISFYFPGTLIDEAYIFEHFYFARESTIIKLGGYVNEAPTGAAIIVDLVKNGVEQSRLFTIPAGANSPGGLIDITDITYGTVDKLDIKIKQVGSINPGAGLQINLYYM